MIPDNILVDSNEELPHIVQIEDNGGTPFIVIVRDTFVDVYSTKPKIAGSVDIYSNIFCVPEVIEKEFERLMRIRPKKVWLGTEPRFTMDTAEFFGGAVLVQDIQDQY